MEPSGQAEGMHVSLPCGALAYTDPAALCGPHSVPDLQHCPCVQAAKSGASFVELVNRALPFWQACFACANSQLLRQIIPAVQKGNKQLQVVVGAQRAGFAAVVLSARECAGSLRVGVRATRP